MSEFFGHKKFLVHRDYKYLLKKFDTGYYRQIDQFLVIPYKNRKILVNSFFIQNRIDDEDGSAEAILNLFSEPLPFVLFLKKLSEHFKLDLNLPTKENIRLFCDLLSITRLLVEDHFLVFECFNEYSQLSQFRKNLLHTRFVHVAYVMTSLDCNFSCPGCFVYSNAPKKKIHMTPEVFDRQLDFLMPNVLKSTRAELSFIFYGGEPLLNKPLVEYAAGKIKTLKKEGAFGKRKVVLSMITNASLIDEKTVEIFKKFDIQPSISLDGVGETHDANRVFSSGRGTFDAVLKGIRLLEKYDVGYGISCTIGPDNIDRLPTDLDWMVKNLKLNGGLFFNIMQGVPKDSFGSLSYDTFKKKMHIIYDKMNELGLSEGRLKRYRMTTSHDKPPYVFYCAAAGSGQFVFRPDGKIGLCHAGMMHDEDQFESPDDIGEIYRNPIRLKWLPRTPLLMKDCYLKCPYFALCAGGCPYRVEKATGNMYRPHPQICEKEMFLMERAIMEDYEATLRSQTKRAAPGKRIKRR